MRLIGLAVVLILSLALAPLHSHAQSFQPIEPVNPLVIDQDTIAAQEEMQTAVSEARPLDRELAQFGDELVLRRSHALVPMAGP